jgi:hypothetical protein
MGLPALEDDKELDELLVETPLLEDRLLLVSLFAPLQAVSPPDNKSIVRIGLQMNWVLFFLCTLAMCDPNLCEL